MGWLFMPMYHASLLFAPLTVTVPLLYKLYRGDTDDAPWGRMNVLYSVNELLLCGTAVWALYLGRIVQALALFVVMAFYAWVNVRGSLRQAKRATETCDQGP